MSVDVSSLAERLLAAHDSCTEVRALTAEVPDLGVDDAYAIQAELIQRRLDRGEVVTGAKVGLTSRAKQLTMGVHEPVYGVLTDRMLQVGSVPMESHEVIHPRVEPEIVFVLAEDLAGPGVSVADVLDATAGVCCGLEVIDSRYEAFKFQLPDVVADNTSASKYVIGPRLVPPGSIDLALVGCLVEHDGTLVSTAAGAAVLGHPAQAVADLANRLGSQGGVLRAGWTVLSGALTDAVAISPGQRVSATFGWLGTVELSMRLSPDDG